jgi:glucosylceramidase
LDSIGGPNHLNNLCDATILAVPHRAINGSGIPPTAVWEKTNSTALFGANHGDERTREELNALGFPAKHLDDGLAVQPMYYYMGHISRYVRPGSEAVMGLVDSGKDGMRPFRSAGSVVAGGGMNDLARVGIEVTAWPCEGSTRQQFHFTENGHISVYGHDWLGTPTESCLGLKADRDFRGITTTLCKEGAGTFEKVDGTDGFVKFVQTNALSGKSDRCLIVKTLQNNGGALGPRGGAQVTFGSCAGPASDWKYSETTEEMISTFLDGEICMTTGWPFLQIGAFSTPNGESDSTVILLNEAKDSANYVLFDGDVPTVSGSIPPRSMQTILLDSA